MAEKLVEAFQSTLPRREWHGFVIPLAPYLHISIHTPTKGVTTRFWVHAVITTISIHTPTKGVTALLSSLYQTQLISIHTPTKGVTKQLLHFSTFDSFQSTLPRREWRWLFFLIHDNSKFQSTLPRREWRIRCHRVLLDLINFNPHSHEGSDPVLFCVFLFCDQFQSTLPRREWRNCPCNAQLLYGHFNPHSHEGSDFPKTLQLYNHFNFNPHSHEGSDERCSIPCTIDSISIHTPTKGVTPFSAGLWAFDGFQSTLPRREWRPLVCSELSGRTISIHTPTKGVTTYCGEKNGQNIFQSTLPRREWRWFFPLGVIPLVFQSTLPRREWRQIRREF